MSRRAHRSNEGTAREHAGAALGVYETVWELFAEAQKRQALHTKGFLESALGNLRTRAERNFDVSEKLVEQAREGRAAGWVLAREPANAYDEFLECLFFYYRENGRAARSGIRQE